MKSYLRKAGVMFVFALFPGCSVQRLDTGEFHPQTGAGAAFRMYKVVRYNEYGIPFFEQEISKKPEGVVETYHLVIMEKGRVIRSVNIGVVDKDPGRDDRNPVAVMYEWTGKGFKTGLDLTKSMVRRGDFVPGPGAGVLVFMAAPIAVIGAGGFLVGLVEGTVIALKDLKGLFHEGREYLLGYTDYSYDRDERLTGYRIHSPEDTRRIVVETVFLYRGSARSPVSMTVKNIGDGVEKSVRFQ